MQIKSFYFLILEFSWTYILCLEERLIQSCKPCWVPWDAGISEWTMPLPAVIHCKSPAPILPLCPLKSSCVIAPLINIQNKPHYQTHSITIFFFFKFIFQINLKSQTRGGKRKKKKKYYYNCGACHKTRTMFLPFQRQWCQEEEEKKKKNHNTHVIL